MAYTAATHIWDTSYTPKVTLTRAVDGALTVVIEVTGLDPLRTATAEEQAAGITSLDPLTVSVHDDSDRPAAIRRLVRSSHRGLASAVASTLGRALKPTELTMICARCTAAVRGALRAIDEDA